MRKQAIIISVVVLTLVLIVMGASCGPPLEKEVIIGNKNITELVELPATSS